MNKRVKVLLIIVLVSTLFFFYSNLANENKQHEELRLMLLYENFANLHQQIYKINETLDMYEEDFTDRERDLFKNALIKDIISLQRINLTINRLNRTQNGEFMMYFEATEITISQIASGKITDEDEIKKISTVLSEHGEKVADIIFVEQVGHLSLKNKETIKRFLEIMEGMYKDLSQITGMK